MCCLHTAIHITSLCGFRHCHPNIPLHFWKMFFILVVCYSVVPQYHTGSCCPLSEAPTPLVYMYDSMFVKKGLSPSNVRP